jgi:hypothetical protein
MGLLDTLGSVLTPQSPDTLNALYDNDPAKLKDIQNKALMSQGFNTLLSYFAQPKNQRYGSFIPYLAKAVGSGNEAAQNVYTNATQDFITGQKIADIKTKQANEAGLKNAFATYDPNNYGQWLQNNFQYLPQETQASILAKPQRIEDLGGTKQAYDIFGNAVGKPIKKTLTPEGQIAFDKFNATKNGVGMNEFLINGGKNNNVMQTAPTSQAGGWDGNLPKVKQFPLPTGGIVNGTLDPKTGQYYQMVNGVKYWLLENGAQ